MTTKDPSAITPHNLAQFTGTERWHRLFPFATLYTDGAKFVADKAGAGWLLVEISASQCIPEVRDQIMQVWKLTVHNLDMSATLICEDGDDVEVFRKDIPFTDFPPCGIELWLIDNVILLPSEY